MTARDEILAALKTKRRALAAPGPWESRRDFPDLAARFVEALTRVGGEVFQAADLEAALDQVGAMLAELEPTGVVLDDGPPVDQVDFQERWPGLAWHRPVEGETGDPKAWQALCAGAELGISGADAALAETGTIVLQSGAGRSRLATLLPPVHLALVPRERLQPDLFTWTAARAGKFPAGVTLVSGPSKTADIEQTLAIGVHGPKRFIVVLYE
jgi:L-lactate dehydrogenase complex protein LldG